MHGLTLAFLIALAAETATRLWLATRQIAAVTRHRDEVPKPFRDTIALTDQQKAADYTAARARFSRIASIFEALLLLLFTLGGGIAAVDQLWQRAHWTQPWHGAAVIVTVFALLAIIRLPFSVWRT